MQWGYRQLDKEQHLVKCSEKALLIVDVAKGVGWSRLSVSGLQMLSRALGHYGEGQCPCHLCNTGHLQEIRLIDHILQKHWKELHLLKIGAADLVTMLSNSLVPRPHPLTRRTVW